MWWRKTTRNRPMLFFKDLSRSVLIWCHWWWTGGVRRPKFRKKINHRNLQPDYWTAAVFFGRISESCLTSRQRQNSFPYHSPPSGTTLLSSSSSLPLTWTSMRCIHLRTTNKGENKNSNQKNGKRANIKCKCFSFQNPTSIHGSFTVARKTFSRLAGGCLREKIH